MQLKLVPFWAVLVLLSGCGAAAVDGLRDDAQGVLTQARDRAEAVAGVSAEELREQVVAQVARTADLSAEQLRELSAIEYRTLVVLEADLPDVDHFLNEFGWERWLCYHISDESDGKTFYFQRSSSNAFPTLIRVLRAGRLVF